MKEEDSNTTIKNMKEEDFESIISKFEGLKTRIKYRSSSALGKLLFHKILPYYLPKKAVYYVIYTELKCKKLYRLTRLAGIDGKLYDSIKVIKIGKTDFVPFGRLYEIISETENIDTIFSTLQSTLANLTEDCIIILCGFDILIALEGVQVLRKIREFYEDLPDVTIFLTSRDGIYSDVIDKILEDFHDINLTIQQQEFSESSFVTVEESVLDITSFPIP
ncbi:hypothetical protein Asulf_01101 [Archaeoglobus sulfaticallidus PM70-1]|uniref:DUF835 domain-containing protein n=1 Tax=Archaeoglobus sulfaticallidus PM70-1 TaxID=387631 RepID=N0BKR1_9EURY|nr:hypothetical protein [Archaeoglobus sulfaticallidus]AGK61101.1 hypothetical protein Asulf_01101 [Archaeoglobus sulfaticallidus PM70-1]